MSYPGEPTSGVANYFPGYKAKTPEEEAAERAKADAAAGIMGPPRPEPTPLPPAVSGHSSTAPAPAAERSRLARSLFPFGGPSLGVKLSAFGPELDTVQADVKPAQGSGTDSTKLPRPSGVPPAAPPAAASPAVPDELGAAADFPANIVPRGPAAAPAKPQESIEDLRKRFNLVEYGAPPRGETRRAFGREYKPISQNVGDGRGSFSQMESKLDYEIPSVTMQRIGEKERTLRERGVEAATEGISPVAPGTTALPPRGFDVRRRQEDYRAKQIDQELAAIDQGKAAARADLRSSPDYAAMSPEDRDAAEYAIEDEATRRERRIFLRQMLLQGDRRGLDMALQGKGPTAPARYE